MFPCTVSDRYRFIYVPVPGNAANSLSAEFSKPEYESFAYEYSDIDPKKRADYLTFAFLRDPVARVLSAYREISLRHERGDRDAALPFVDVPDPNQRFLGFLQEVVKRLFDPLVELQSSRLADIDIDHFGSIEHLGKDIAKLFDTLGIVAGASLTDLLCQQAEKDQCDDTRYLLPKESFPEETRNLIRQFYARDFEFYQKNIVQAYAKSGRLLACFQKENEQKEQTFVHRLGGLGFYSELSIVTRAILYCLAHDLKLVIDSREFAYRREHGWSDYFLPFCADLSDDSNIEADVDCHSNVRGPGTVFNELLAHHRGSIRLGNISIRGFEEILVTLFTMIFRLNDQTCLNVEKAIDECGLPERYASVHIRRGDKVGDEDCYYPAELYLDHLEAHGAADLPIFVLSDDLLAVRETQTALRRRRSPVPLFSLCEAQHQGFDVHALRRRKPVFSAGNAATVSHSMDFSEHIGTETLRLLTETIIAIRSDCFVGTVRSNVGVCIKWLHEQPGRCVLLEADKQEGVAANDVFLNNPPLPAIPNDMEIVKLGDREFFLFLDIFVHWSGQKITAVAPYYGDDIDWSEHGIDLDRLVLTFGNHRVGGRYIPHRLDTWEPCILFDFEHPALEAHLRDHDRISFAVSAGAHCEEFVLDTEPVAGHDIAISLIVQDCNQWLPYFLDYYLTCLKVDHVYLYDNYTSDADGLQRIIRPYAGCGQITYIPWHYRWQNARDLKQIGQIPQQAHSLNKFGKCNWIGFFDFDEFLRIPGQTLKQFLADFDPVKFHGLSFGMRWFMYKGELALEKVGNPLLNFFDARHDSLGRKRQKVIVSPRDVRFLRIHWLEDDKPEVVVDDTDIYFHHYYLNRGRFEKGKTEPGTVRDDYMLGFAEPLIRAGREHTDKNDVGNGRAAKRHPQPRPDTAEEWIAHVLDAFDIAKAEGSGLSADVLNLPGMCGRRNRHFLNALCAFENCRYLEIGSFKGASLCAAMYRNRISAVAIENWSQFDGPRIEFMAAITENRGTCKLQVIEQDCFTVEPAGLGPFDVYYYDGDHGADSHARAIKHFYDCLDDRAVIIVDDWNRDRVREGTRRAMAELDIPIIFEKEIILPEADVANMPHHKGRFTWWNGVYVMIVDKQAAPLSTSTRPRTIASIADRAVDPRMPIAVIVFSKDRACQLEALLRSMERFFEHPHRTTILYAASDSDYQRGYNKLMERYENVTWTREIDFRNDLLHLIDESRESKARHVMFLVDDIVFTHHFTGQNMIELLEQDDDILAVSLRLGDNIRYCHPRDMETGPPEFLNERRWAWSDAPPGYWDYPMSVDGNIYRLGDILEIMTRIRFHNPNTFESSMFGQPIDRPYLVCQPVPCLVNLALNLVQDEFDNPHGNISAEYLNRCFLDGSVIDIEPFAGREFPACHIEPEITLIQHSQAIPPDQRRRGQAGKPAEQWMDEAVNPPSRAGEFEESPRDGGVALRWPGTRQEIILNSAAKEIWALCDGANTARDMVRILSRRFDCDKGALRMDVRAALRQFEKIGLIEPQVPVRKTSNNRH